MNMIPPWFRPLNREEIARMARQLAEMRMMERLQMLAGRQVRPKQ